MTKINIPKFLESDDRPEVYTVITMPLLTDLLLPFQAAKDKEYQSHWARRGLLGYKHGCMLRQSDRIEPGFEGLFEACEFDTKGEVIINDDVVRAAASLMDTLIDSAIYSMLGVCMIAGKFPKAGEAFKRKLFHRVMHGTDMADSDLDTVGEEELVANIARYYKDKLVALDGKG